MKKRYLTLAAWKEKRRREQRRIYLRNREKRLAYANRRYALLKQGRLVRKPRLRKYSTLKEIREAINLRARQNFKENKAILIEAHRPYLREYYSRNRDKILRRRCIIAKATGRVERAELHDKYIKGLISSNFKIPRKEIPTSLIEAKRNHLRVLRLLRGN